MDTSRQGQKELEVEGSWIPNTPLKPIPPKPAAIYGDSQGNQLGQANLLESKEFSSGFTQASQANRASACFDPANCNWEAALGVKNSCGSDNMETCRDFPMNYASRCNLPCAALWALADAADKEDSSPKSNQWSNGSCTQEENYEFPIFHGPAFNINFPPGRPANAFYRKTTSQFAPLTPDEATRVEFEKLTEMQYLCKDERTNQEIMDNGIAATGVDANGLQAGKELQNPETDSSFAAVSTVFKENHNPDKGGSKAIDLSETPQQKPRRKRHRPKVVTEGKPKRTPKSVTPKPATSKENPTGKRKYVRQKPATSKENPTGKRKYVRRKPLNKASTPPAEAAGESSDPKILEADKKSCRRALNFDVEGEPRDDSSKCKNTFNLDSEPQAQDCIAGNQSKITVCLGYGIEVVVEKTETAIAYDLTSSVNQMVKDYVSLPEKQAPCTPAPAQANCQQKRHSASSQENYAKGKDGATAHNVQENAAQISQLSPISPNGSNCSACKALIEEGQARGSKRKLSSSIEHPDTCSTNIIGSHYNALPTYQIWAPVNFPGFCTKKRTEKGENSTASSTSSSVTAAKDIVGLETTCQQMDSEGDPSTSKVNYWFSAPHHNANGLPGTCIEGTGHQYKQQTFGCILSQAERSTKKRSRGPTRARDLASLVGISGCAMHPTYPARQVPVDCDGQRVRNSHRPDTSIEVLIAEMHSTMTTKKRTKKRVSLVNAASASINEGQSHGKLILYNRNQFSAKSLGALPEVIQQQMLADEIVERLKHLDVNAESSDIVYKDQNALVSYNIGNENQNALVLYRRDGTIVPFDGTFESIKKRRPRPKVDLDDETNRVWKLLMGNINSEGIDGTDEEKAKWWEEERRVFRGRADSFIARMHLVQGDRRFSQWKGSVVDSVVGVFLTQNVSDHLSSSAFMSLAAHFPLKSKGNYKPCYEERTGSAIDKPMVHMPDPEDTIRWHKEMSNQSICDQSSMTLHVIDLDEEREGVNSNESSGSSVGIVSSGNGLETCYESIVNGSNMEITEPVKVSYIEEMRATNNALSTQNSAVSSQNSVDSPIAQTAERKELHSENNSEAEDLTDGFRVNSLNGSTSFVELLQKVGSTRFHEVYSQGNGNVLSDQNSKDECNKTQSVGIDFLRQKMENFDGPKSSLGVSVIPSSNFHFHLTPNLGVVEAGCFKMITEERRYSDVSENKHKNSEKDHSAFTAESASQITDQNKMIMTIQEAITSTTGNTPSCNNIQEDEHISIQFQSRLVEDHKIVGTSLAQLQNNEMQRNLFSLDVSGDTMDIVESTSAFDKQEKNLQKTTESDLIEHGYSQSKELNEKNDATRKAKARRVGNEIKDNVDWDALRKQGEASGRKRERTANTMDSLDWEAVRCADVNEIANTIKERGMNNMLAERIKAFLNRLVREHGSIDLEWLRDIPPDKAKEYLLSIRGLGLKSVECVRLLTLHHLAFPVDTNVGRIAVRLGWVPLQPLPESLQLHLLELYPVLESIQKYLWPRLCKLDQRTLYELHYQMITFGKVFCTKSKPNCNACPMRGECRHFASAFASARLALPGPEEKSIVCTNENRTTGQIPAVIADQPPLALPQATEQSAQNQQSEASLQPEAKPGFGDCKPIIEEPSSPEPECTQAIENDMEDIFCEDPEEIPTIKLNIEEFTQNLQAYMQENMELQEGEMSRALVALTAEAASIPTPKLKNVSRLRTEHHVYELPDSHPLLQGLDRREPDDPCYYLLAIWTPGETADSIQPPERRCSTQEYGKLCDEKTCFSCNSIREQNSQIVRGTLLIPCRTAMRGSFPLNGTYFQVNEVFADHDSSLNPIDVPRAWIWNLPRRTVYFGTSIPTIFKGLTTEGIQHCFWRGYVCVRGFDQKTRAPRPLMARLHFPASKLARTKGKDVDG